MDPLSLFDLPVPNIGRIAADALVHARDILGLILNRFFTPHQLAMFVTIEREKRADFIRWLRVIEEMLRRTLFLEASAIATSLPPPAPSRTGKKQTARKPVAFSEDPEAWRVSFAIAPRPVRAGRKSAPRTRSERREFLLVWPLAHRVEAILRVARDPHPFIQRLALRLRRGVQRYRNLTAPFLTFYGRAQPTLRELAVAIAPRFADSS